MYKMIPKDIIQKNMNNIIQSEFFCDLYNRICETDELNLMEENSAKVFNTALFACQLVESGETIKAIMIDLLKNADYGYGGTLSVSAYEEEVYLKTLQKYDESYLENGHEKMIERLKHGVAVHFTTPRILEKIERDGCFRAYNSMFSKEAEEKIIAAQKYQQEHDSTAEKTGRVLSQGFGFSKGISMASQTNSFWMNHTPESLTFLFGGKLYTRNKAGAMQHVMEATSSLPDEQKKEVCELLENIWDDLVGEDKSLGCVLIDRDALEYEKVTYWNETPPRVEEQRPYRDGTLNSLNSMEDSRYGKDIPVSGLKLLKVPSIYQLEMYRREHPILEEDKIKPDIPVFEEELDIDFSDLSDDPMDEI